MIDTSNEAPFVKKADVQERIYRATDELAALKEEVADLEELMAQCNGCAGWDGRDSEGAIRGDCMEEMAREQAEDLLGDAANAWPCDMIDWEKAAAALKQDYRNVNYGGASFFVHQ